jgi:hypothetical protein
MIFSENRYPPAELGCSRVLPLSIAQVGNIRLAHSGVPEFCHCQLRKSETSDLRTRVFPSSGIFTWTQIANIRFAVVKPKGRLFRDHALGHGQGSGDALQATRAGSVTPVLHHFIPLRRARRTRLPVKQSSGRFDSCEGSQILPVHRRIMWARKLLLKPGVHSDQRTPQQSSEWVAISVKSPQTSEIYGGQGAGLTVT